MDETIRENYFIWLDKALARPFPDDTGAFHFNLYEYGASVGIELMGVVDLAISGDYCDPGEATFYTDDDRFQIPFSVAGEKWPQWLETCKALTLEYLTHGKQSEILRQSRGVGIGFTDGDLYLLWPK